MSEKRRDNRNRILREGEYQRKDGRYRFRYIDEDGKEKNVYSLSLIHIYYNDTVVLHCYWENTPKWRLIAYSLSLYTILTE